MLHERGNVMRKTFSLEIVDSTQTTSFANIVNFIGADESGSFGIMANHAPFIAVLRTGLLRFEDQENLWHYAAMPSGILMFKNNKLSITSIRCFFGKDPDVMLSELSLAIKAEDSNLHHARVTLAKIERSLIRRLASLQDGREDSIRL